MFQLHFRQAQLYPQRARIQCNSSQAEGVDISTIVSQFRMNALRSSSYFEVLIWSCTFSEQKIDDIARGIDGIKLLLQGLNVPPDEKQPENGSIGYLNQAESVKPLTEHQPISASGGEPLWDHSAHIIDFVIAVVEDIGSRDIGPEASEVLSSLRNLVQTLEGRAAARDLSFPGAKVVEYQADPPMPPLEAVVAVLRWAKGSLPTTDGCHECPNMNIRSRGVY